MSDDTVPVPKQLLEHLSWVLVEPENLGALRSGCESCRQLTRLLYPEEQRDEFP